MKLISPWVARLTPTFLCALLFACATNNNPTGAAASTAIYLTNSYFCASRDGSGAKTTFYTNEKEAVYYYEYGVQGLGNTAILSVEMKYDLVDPVGAITTKTIHITPSGFDQITTSGNVGYLAVQISGYPRAGVPGTYEIRHYGKTPTQNSFGYLGTISFSLSTP